MSAWNVSVLTGATSDTEPTLLVNFGTAKYIFNASEGMGRAWLQSQHSVRKTKGLFVTAAGTHRCGGVPGLLMLCADAAVPAIDIVGPYGLMHYLATMRGYTYRSNMVVKAIEAPTALVHASQPTDVPTPVFKDENLSVYSIPLYPSADGTVVGDPSARPLKRKRSPSPPSVSKRSTPPLIDHTVESTSPVSPAVSAHAQEENFNPTTLIGQDAQEWRKLMLQEMFPMQPAPKADPSMSKGAKRRAKEVQESADSPPPSNNRKYPPDRKYARLPGLVPGGGVDPATLPTIGYLCVGPAVRGKFDVKKAEELGVPRGPIRGRLTKGEAVTFEVDDGQGGKIQRTVQPEECVGPTEAPQAVLILDVPTPAHIPSLLASFTESPFFAKYRSKAADVRKEYPMHAVYHLCGEGVLEDERYKEFMNGFSEETHHLISSREYTPDKITFTRSALVQAKLHQLDAEMFPIPKYNLSPSKDITSVAGLPAKAILAEPNTLVHVRPVRPPVQDELAREDEFNPLAVSASLPELSDSVMEKFAAVKAKAAERMGRGSPATAPGDDVVITPLGTGSAIPTRMRNVSSTLIQIPGHGNILLDCGEGTWGQLVRSFGDTEDGVWQVMRDLKCIFLSHMHGDHHMGLSKILTMRAKMDPPPSEPLYVVGLRSHLMYLLERQELEDHGLADPNGIIMILSDALNWRFPRPYGKNQTEDEPFMNHNLSYEHAEAMCRALGLRSFTTVDVAHRIRCYGVVIRHNDGWGIAFSGDTMPTENLVKVGRDVTLLIHESSMSPEEEDLAREKAHSTSAQAIDIGRRMRAKNLLLTHFSARYPGMPPRHGDSSGGPIIGIAFDFARIRMGAMWKLNAYLPAIQHTFNEFGEEEPIEIDLTKLQ
ncbi:hypothetical protein L226DRAFT_479775 [Lentinus tigrinus ALCF2SS1-7]|uniref:ribonuclease Z n=1 Tax=Lentinus tigrinus ALCF2SS1-6 TaxID=1328759 RepID=A0A5C2SP16_9APHY|nr:hypothetical protein L227DRAFT_649631 [Lentinus tigrinus ALCF2SS1-6]RPD79008.1 hypothetical protein L226DRAFT_479775 [Lentinus tigrinus ALCF2SS1-7]